MEYNYRIPDRLFHHEPLLFDMGLNTTVIDYSNVDARMVCALIGDPGIFR